MHAGNEEGAHQLTSLIEDKFLKNPLYFSPISAAVGLHAGYGCLAIAVLFEEK